MLAPNHRLRSLVVPSSTEGELTGPGRKQLLLFRGHTGRGPKRRRDGEPRREPRARMPWPLLMQRTWGVDVLACAGCGGRMQLVAVATQPRAIQRLLAGMSKPSDLPVTRLARGPPVDQLGLFSAEDAAGVAVAAA